MSAQSDRISEQLRTQGNVFRKTCAHMERKIVITPENGSMQYLCYARTLLDGETLEARFQS